MFKYKQQDAQGGGVGGKRHLRKAREQGRPGMSSTMQKYSEPKMISQNTYPERDIETSNERFCLFLLSSKRRKLNQTIR